LAESRRPSGAERGSTLEGASFALVAHLSGIPLRLEQRRLDDPDVPLALVSGRGRMSLASVARIFPQFSSFARVRCWESVPPARQPPDSFWCLYARRSGP
jgi:hypothetical protein